MKKGGMRKIFIKWILSQLRNLIVQTGKLLIIFGTLWLKFMNQKIDVR